MGSPCRGSSLRCGRTHSIETKVFFSEPCSKTLRDEVTLWVVGREFPLDHERRIFVGS